MFFARVNSMTWRIVMSGFTVIGSLITPPLEFLHAVDLARLIVDGHVLVDDADTASWANGNGQAGFGDRNPSRRRSPAN